MRMVLLFNVVLLGILLIVWGVYGPTISDFHKRGDRIISTFSPRGVSSSVVTPRGAE